MQGNAKHINARLKEGHTVEEMKTVIDRKVAEWKGGPMDEYLRPSTLFNSEKFEGYLNAGPKQASQSVGPIPSYRQAMPKPDRPPRSDQ